MLLNKENIKKERVSFSAIGVTIGIIAINIGVFILMALNSNSISSFDTDMLLKWGANYAPDTMQGQWWRLLSCTFLHAGVMHLLPNMYVLFFIGRFLEPRLGKVKYTFIYLLTGIIASATTLWWHTRIVGGIQISVGASGAIFGLCGCLVALLLRRNFDDKIDKQILPGILIFIVANVANGLLKENIDNAAHIGGVLSGLLFGLIVSTKPKSVEKEESVLEQVQYHAKPKYPELIKDKLPYEKDLEEN